MDEREKDTRKKIRSWGLQEKCPIILQGGEIVDPGKFVHNTSPPQRGIYLISVSAENYSNSQKATKAAEDVHNSYCGGYQYESCKFRRQCFPAPAAIVVDGSWKPAIRPRKQRP